MRCQKHAPTVVLLEDVTDDLQCQKEEGHFDAHSVVVRVSWSNESEWQVVDEIDPELLQPEED